MHSISWVLRRAVVGGFALAPMGAAAVASAQPVGTIYQTTLMEPGQKTPEVTTEALRMILADKSAIVLDTRPFLEYAMSHVPGELNVAAKPGVSMSMYVSDVAEIGRLVGGDKTKPLILYCNGPFCGKSKRLSDELLAAGYTSVRRYQLGIPVWRALVGLTEIELEGVVHVFKNDRTTVFLDACTPEKFQASSIRGARNIPSGGVQSGKDVGEVRTAKDDGRLPIEDHNTRIIVFGRDADQVRAVAAAIAREAFHNVAYFPGTYDTLASALK